MDEFNQFIEDIKLTDIPLIGRSFTWYKSNEKAKSRIDRVLVSRVWQGCVQYVLNGNVSNHWFFKYFLAYLILWFSLIVVTNPLLFFPTRNSQILVFYSKSYHNSFFTQRSPNNISNLGHWLLGFLWCFGFPTSLNA